RHHRRRRSRALWRGVAVVRGALGRVVRIGQMAPPRLPRCPGGNASKKSGPRPPNGGGGAQKNPYNSPRRSPPRTERNIKNKEKGSGVISGRRGAPQAHLPEMTPDPFSLTDYYSNDIPLPFSATNFVGSQ